MQCDFVNVYLRHQKVWVPDDPADPAGPGHWDWELKFQGGEMKFNDPDADEKWETSRECLEGYRDFHF